jgi:ribosome-binding factor A
LAQGHRPDRVGEQIRDVLSEVLTRGEVHDPGIGFITLTRVQVTSDLQIARVFYTSLGDPKARKETARALDRATPFFRRQVAGRLRLRRTPELEFRFDESIENQDRIEQILRDLHDEDAQRAQADAVNPESRPSTRSSIVEASGRPEPIEGRIADSASDDDASHD